MTDSSRAYMRTFLRGASRFATALPKFPAPITPTGLSSDKLFKVIAYQSVVIIVQSVQVAGDDVAFLVQQQRSLQMEYAHVLEAVANHQINITFQVRGMVDFLFLFQFVDALAHLLA